MFRKFPRKFSNFISSFNYTNQQFTSFRKCKHYFFAFQEILRKCRKYKKTFLISLNFLQMNLFLYVEDFQISFSLCKSAIPFWLSFLHTFIFPTGNACVPAAESPPCQRVNYVIDDNPLLELVGVKTLLESKDWRDIAIFAIKSEFKKTTIGLCLWLL